MPLGNKQWRMSWIAENLADDFFRRRPYEQMRATMCAALGIDVWCVDSGVHSLFSGVHCGHLIRDSSGVSLRTFTNDLHALGWYRERHWNAADGVSVVQLIRTIQSRNPRSVGIRPIQRALLFQYHVVVPRYVARGFVAGPFYFACIDHDLGLRFKISGRLLLPSCAQSIPTGEPGAAIIGSHDGYIYRKDPCGQSIWMGGACIVVFISLVSLRGCALADRYVAGCRDKLKPFGFSVHGAIDGYSRKLMYVALLPSNKDPRAIVPLYLKVVRQLGRVPVTVVGDHGCAWRASPQWIDCACVDSCVSSSRVGCEN